VTTRRYEGYAPISRTRLRTQGEDEGGERKYATRYFSAALSPAIAWLVRLIQKHQERCLNDLYRSEDCRQTKRVIIRRAVKYIRLAYCLREHRRATHLA